MYLISSIVGFNAKLISISSGNNPSVHTPITPSSATIPLDLLQQANLLQQFHSRIEQQSATARSTSIHRASLGDGQAPGEMVAGGDRPADSFELKYPVLWQGQLGMKNSHTFVEMHKACYIEYYFIYLARC